MEQEFAEAPHSASRTFNIVRKGLAARLGETGIVGSTFERTEQSRASLGTISALSLGFVVLALYFWSYSMLLWNSDYRWQSSAATSLWTGSLTISAALLVLLVTTVLGALLGGAIKAVVRHHPKNLSGPVACIAGALTLIVLSVSQSLHFLIARGGVQWGHPGQAVKQIAGATISATGNVIWAWTPSGNRLWSYSGVVYALAPVGVVVLAVAVGVLVRRTNYAFANNRASRVTMFSLAGVMALFLVSFLGWIASGGSQVAVASGFQPLTKTDGVLLGVMTVMALLGAQTTLNVWRRRALSQ
jgi:hypothetical protein